MIEKDIRQTTIMNSNCLFTQHNLLIDSVNTKPHESTFNLMIIVEHAVSLFAKALACEEMCVSHFSYWNIKSNPEIFNSLCNRMRSILIFSRLF